MLKNLLAALLASIVFVEAAQADSADDRLRRLHDLYQCPIFAYLVAIKHVPTPTRTDNRFLSVTINHRVDQRFYAQCAFEKQDRRMHCEVSSPFFNPELKPYFSGDRLKLIKFLGYHGRSKNNFYQKRDARSAEALYKIAGLLVDTLGDVFDMAPDEGLIYEAPLVKQPPKDTAEGSKFCAPMISLR